MLFHQFGSDKGSWIDLALWLQNRPDETASTGGMLAAPALQFGWFPPLPDDLSFAVFAVDFRDHGESESVTGNLEVSGFLLDAQASLDYAKTLPNVDSSRIITMGASIGADASVDVCLSLDSTAIADEQADEGCIGAMPLSPGSFLEVPYALVVTRLGEAPFNVNIHCIAAELDGNSPDLCETEAPGRHQATVYSGRNEHGIALLAEGFDPDIGQLIHDFLLETLEIEG
jgi:dienelactone hydrolase